MQFYGYPYIYNYRTNDNKMTVMEETEDIDHKEDMDGMVGITPLLSLDRYTYPQNLPGAISLIREAVSGEKEDENFYNYLISIAPNQDAKNTISKIRDDEMKHNKMFRVIYQQLTKQTVMEPTNIQFNRPENYCEGLKQALIGELTAVERYRRIAYAMRERVHINMMTEIITDEIKHAILYNMLIQTANCY